MQTSEINPVEVASQLIATDGNIALVASRLKLNPDELIANLASTQIIHDLLLQGLRVRAVIELYRTFVNVNKEVNTRFSDFDHEDLVRLHGGLTKALGMLLGENKQNTLEIIMASMPQDARQALSSMMGGKK